MHIRMQLPAVLDMRLRNQEGGSLMTKKQEQQKRWEQWLAGLSREQAAMLLQSLAAKKD